MGGGFFLWGMFISLVGAGTFGWQIINELRSGITRIPIQLFGDDDYVRGQGMFGFAIAMNCLGVAGFLGLAYKIWSGQ